VLPARVRRVLVPALGIGLGLLVIMKIIDMGFMAVLARPFDPVADWPLFRPAVEVLIESIGQPRAIAAAVGAGLLAVALLVVTPLALGRLSRLVLRHDVGAARSVAVLSVAALACAAFGVRVVPDVPSATLAYEHLRQVPATLLDQRAFTAELADDPFRHTPGDQLLTALRGKDVLVTFVESYGRSAVEDPAYAPRVGALLARGERRLSAAGYAARSGFLRSPTTGGGSWLAHATLLSGVWVDNERRYRGLVASDRLTLNGAFRRADWRTVGVMPLIVRDWPEGRFYGYDKLYAARDLRYRGARFSMGTIPDQYTLSMFRRKEHGPAARPPIMAEIALVSSHGPWTPIPRFINWHAVDNGPAFSAMVESQPRVWRDPARARDGYLRSIEYTLTTLLSYVERYGDDDLVLVFLGDHQPSPVVTGADASLDVPITIVARDHTVLDRIDGWGWHAGLKPGPDAPVWPMNEFRNRFLTAFGSAAAG
jgi:hypothetical protein